MLSYYMMFISVKLSESVYELPCPFIICMENVWSKLMDFNIVHQISVAHSTNIICLLCNLYLMSSIFKQTCYCATIKASTNYKYLHYSFPSGITPSLISCLATAFANVLMLVLYDMCATVSWTLIIVVSFINVSTSTYFNI